MGLDPKTASDALGVRHEVQVSPGVREVIEAANRRGLRASRRRTPGKKRPQAAAPATQTTEPSPWRWTEAQLKRAAAFRAAGKAEDAEQYLLACALDAVGLRWAHPPNGGGRSAREGAEFQLLGVKPGLPDILVFSRPVGRPWVAGAAIELKAPERRTKTNPTSGTSESQRCWLSGLSLEGWITTVAYSAAEALTWLAGAGYTIGGSK